MPPLRAAAALVLLLAVGPLSAIEPVSEKLTQGLACGTTDTNLRRLRAVANLAERKQKLERIRSNGAPSATLRDGMFSMSATPLNSPFKRPFDLAQTSIRFSRASDGTYSATKVPYSFDSDVGPVLRTLSRSSRADWYYVRLPLKGFTFPFFDQSYDAVYLTAFATVEFSAPLLTQLNQFGPLDAVAQSSPIIAALATSPKNPSTFKYPTVSVRELPEATRITWRAESEEFVYDVQMTLNRSGEVLLTYGPVKGLSWGSLMFTSGRESWRSRVSPVASLADEADDVNPTFYAAAKPMLDVRSVEVSRVASTDLIELKLKLNAPINRSAIRTDDALQYFVMVGEDESDLWNGVILQLPQSGSYEYIVSGTQSSDSAAVKVDGDTIRMLVLEEQLSIPPGATSVPLQVFTSAWSNENFADQASVAVTFGKALAPAMLDVSEMTTATSERPLFESFTLGTFNPDGVWSQLKAQYRLNDEDVDGVAIYQTFYTDIVFYAGAYSTVGNPAADGVGDGVWRYGTGYPRRPALLHLNKFDYGYNSASASSSHVSLHEFGHRWLLHLAIREGSQNTRSLNPISAHPAQYVHTPAAFNVLTSNDSSVMGGSVFTDQGNGTFKSGASAAYGFSWLDLYLMGLARPEEVTPFFYIAGTDLGGAYYPPANVVVSGTRRDVTIDNVVGAMGNRTTSTESAQRSFRVVFVLVTEPGVPPTQQQWEKMLEHRRIFEADFAKATGGRGDVKTFYVEPLPERRRLVRR